MELQVRNIFGKKVKISQQGGNTDNSIHKVTSLPDTGTEGDFYYNLDTKQYYGYDGTNFVELNPKGLKIGDNLINEFPLEGEIIYTLKPNTFYDSSNLYVNNNPLILNFEGIQDSNVVNSYVFRITIPNASFNMTFNNVVIPSITKDILDDITVNHTYEFNILGNVLLVTDITTTA